MTNFTKSLSLSLGALAALSASATSAQRMGNEKSKDAKPQGDEVTTTTGPTSTTGRKFDISKGANKAIVSGSALTASNPR